MAQSDKLRKLRRRRRVRGKLLRTSEHLRLSVFRSNRYIYAQIIDDSKNITVASESDVRLKTEKNGPKTERARKIGVKLSKKLAKLKIGQVVFDRGSYKYEGRVKALAEGVRAGGVKI